MARDWKGPRFGPGSLQPKLDILNHPSQRQSPVTIKSRFRHQPWRPTPTSPPAVGKGQAPVRRCRLGNPPPLGPNGLGGRAPFVKPSGSWLPLRHPAGVHKIGASRTRGGGRRQRWQPHPWRRQTGCSHTLPAKRSVVHLSCLSKAHLCKHQRAGHQRPRELQRGVARPAGPTRNTPMKHRNTHETPLCNTHPPETMLSQHHCWE